MIESGRATMPEHVRRTLRHDLRTPINHIMNYSQLARDDAEDMGLTDMCRDLDGVLAAAGVALDLVGRWLDAEASPGEVDTARIRLEGTGEEIARSADQLAANAAAAALGEATVSDLTRIGGAARTLLTTMGRAVDVTAMKAAGEFLGRSPKPASVNQATRPMIEQATILVADDDHLNRDILGRMLTRLGHTVLFAENGRDALAVLAEKRIDMVLLDIMMPELNGYEVLEARKQSQALRDIPVVVISGYNDVESVSSCIELGAEDYLAKPFDVVLLRARVGACLEKKAWRDQEVAYLRMVSEVATAAVAVEKKTFKPEMIADVAARTDELGHLARAVQHMANEVAAREERLAQQVRRLTVEVDEARKAHEVEEITSSEYFRSLQERAKALRGRRSLNDEPRPTTEPTPT
jgi:CheY-like chemotaxis protein